MPDKTVDYATPTRHGSQAGTFVGDPGEIHIHIVGDNCHVTAGGKRKNFYMRADKMDSVRAAIDHLKAKGRVNTSGYQHCLAWLTNEARKIERPKAKANTK